MQQMDRGFRGILLAIAVVVFCLATAVSGLAQTMYSTDPLLVNQQSSMCLGVPGATFSYAQLVQWYCNGSTDQNWLPNPSSAFDSGGQTYTEIVDQLTGQCISVAGSSPDLNAAVVQWPCVGGPDQYWTMVDVGNGYFQIVNYNSGMCMGVSSSSLSAGANIVQWPCAGPGDQYWRFNAPGRPRISNDFTILVNGSFNEFPDWMVPSTPEYQAIGMSFGGQETTFNWGGDDVVFPGYSAIYDAASGLANFINTHSFAPGEGLNIVAHSHGGNVVKIATTLGLSHPINNLVNLGTPQNFDLPGIDTSQVVNYCQVSSVADLVQFFGASPLQVDLYLTAQANAIFYQNLADQALINGDDDSFLLYESTAAGFQAEAEFWFFSTKIDLAANNVLFSTLGHSDLHEVPVWNVLRYACGLPN